MPGSEVNFRIVVGDYMTTVGNGLYSEQFTALCRRCGALEEASCDAGDDGYVALHEPYGAVEHRLFAQAVYRPSLRRTC